MADTIQTSVVDAALQRACAGLLGYQADDGHFLGDLDQGAGPTAQTIIMQRYLGVLDPNAAEAAVRWLSERIRSDGGVAAYPGSVSASLAETCAVLGALAAAGIPESDPRRRRLQEWIDTRGGTAAADPLSCTFLVMADVLPASVLPEMPIEHALIPGIARYIGRTFNAYFGLALGFMLPGLIHGLRTRTSKQPGPITRAARARILEHLLSHQNPEGNWIGSQWATCMALSCLFALGMERTHDSVVRGLSSLQRMKRTVQAPAGESSYFISIDGAVWNTAMALRVLTRAGAALGQPLDDGSRRAKEYLLACQSATPAPDDWTGVGPFAPRTGGWSFEVGNMLLPDTDTTAMVMLALADHAEEDRTRSALDRGRQWLLALQTDGGGFAAFARHQRTAPPGPLFGHAPPMPTSAIDKLRFFTRPPYEFQDIPTADLTGRVLCALGRLGGRRSHEAIERALRFVYSQRLGDVWWGRWTTNYLAATSFILPGLLAVGEEPDSAPVQRAVTWMLNHQNEDGGFGESNQSYANPELAGQGPSNAYTTGLVLHALCAVGLGQTAAAARAASYLCTSQRTDGLWEEFQALQLTAAETFYKNFVNFQTAPIEGLAIYLNGRNGRNQSVDSARGVSASSGGRP